MSTVLFTNGEFRIFVKTASEKYKYKLEKLGFIPLFYTYGFMHSTAFPEELKVAWKGNARDLFSKKNQAIYKLLLAQKAGDKIK
jgi:hypothetical protein